MSKKILKKFYCIPFFLSFAFLDRLKKNKKKVKKSLAKRYHFCINTSATKS